MTWIRMAHDVWRVIKTQLGEEAPLMDYEPATEDEIRMARQLYRKFDLVDISADAGAIRGEHGSWVMAWVYVPKEAEPK